MNGVEHFRIIPNSDFPIEGMWLWLIEALRRWLGWWPLPRRTPTQVPCNWDDWPPTTIILSAMYDFIAWLQFSQGSLMPYSITCSLDVKGSYSHFSSGVQLFGTCSGQGCNMVTSRVTLAEPNWVSVSRLLLRKCYLSVLSNIPSITLLMIEKYVMEQ